MALPSSVIDRIALSVFLLGGPYTFFYEFYIVSGHYFGDQYPSWIYFHVCIGMFGMLETYWNLYYVNITSNIVPQSLWTKPKDQTDGKKCMKCAIGVPPRSHHCKLCDKCILKRDHHCWFAATCIGHNNHRYYVVMILYVWIAAVYANLYNLQFNMYHIRTFGDLAVTLAGPHVGLLLGWYTAYDFYIRVMTALGVYFLVMFTWLLGLQLVQLQHGQTQYEWKKKIEQYDRGLKFNLKAIVGQRVIAVWFLPWISSPLLSNGMDYTRGEKMD
ncbi:unnamed protein product [Owenia fusiformis]|uniref:Palmitoyltransferase n=1 Tax=Owenia fusiformis TaxID=6347 RepID=A0A8S4MZ32_OWEFU|nr:unnamed protein product [Owenia fusiformis]